MVLVLLRGLMAELFISGHYTSSNKAMFPFIKICDSYVVPSELYPLFMLIK